MCVYCGLDIQLVWEASHIRRLKPFDRLTVNYLRLEQVYPLDNSRNPQPTLLMTATGCPQLWRWKWIPLNNWFIPKCMHKARNVVSIVVFWTDHRAFSRYFQARMLPNNRRLWCPKYDFRSPLFMTFHRIFMPGSTITRLFLSFFWKQIFF